MGRGEGGRHIVSARFSLSNTQWADGSKLQRAHEECEDIVGAIRWILEVPHAVAGHSNDLS